ncbi:LD-carboxypeptidase [Mammaliicoccus sciuri]|uniref:S66 peptidase family protein n=1 Tax=Mammaliicoccus sciuri TaxID=1296 RepID=UPI001FB55821|nr:LD-carboxypeptidase [Mammaliicoccus sciuri]MCJ0922585.1 LD-carboxypeptidase [Mammaliicoccus sciuri]MCJ1761242.1 LD-carboxypeptidase [Mammaliicoccus sciuri]
MKAKGLNRGDVVGVVALASPPNQKHLKNGLKLLEEKYGIRFKLAKNIDRVHGHLAGTDDERLDSLHDMLEDDEVKGIICACGGYGTPRIVERIDYNLVKAHPKIIWGYSDITCLHNAIRQQTGLVTFQGPMIASDIGDTYNEISIGSFEQLFNGEAVSYPANQLTFKSLVGGRVEGEIVGGCLSLLVSSLGTPYEIDTKGKILFIEDIGEVPYKVDGFLQHLKSASKLDDASGFIFGPFTDSEPKNPKKSLTMKEVLDDFITPLNKPAVYDLNIGHCTPHFAIPFGTQTTLDVDNKVLKIASGVIIE